MACTRLAPVQCVHWGHPLTTGLPTVDYFLSGRRLEVPEADAHYVEKLVRFERVPMHYERPVLSRPAKSRAELGFSERVTLYGCPQTLFKFHPEFDALLAGVLRGAPNVVPL